MLGVGFVVVVFKNYMKKNVTKRGFKKMFSRPFAFFLGGKGESFAKRFILKKKQIFLKKKKNFFIKKYFIGFGGR